MRRELRQRLRDKKHRLKSRPRQTKHLAKIEASPRLDGRNMTMVLAPDKRAQADAARAAARESAAASGDTADETHDETHDDTQDNPEQTEQ